MTEQLQPQHRVPETCCTPWVRIKSGALVALEIARVSDPGARLARLVTFGAGMAMIACGAGQEGGPMQGGFGGDPPTAPAGPGNSTPNDPAKPTSTDPNMIGGLPTGGPASGGPGTDMEGCDNVLDVTYRDFEETHPDFEAPFSGDEVRLQLVESQLDASGKPIFRSSIGCPWSHDDPTVCGDWTPTQKVIESKATFDQWYNTVEGVNMEFQKELTLSETANGSGVYVFETSEFFPLLPEEGFGQTPPNGQGRNYLFTTEIHLMFTYVAGQTFSFRGDDDLWIFINNKLALDLGSMHNPAEGTIDFDAQASELGIAPRGVYRMDVFHAERHTQVSSFRIETNIGCFTPAPPRIL